MLWQEVLAVLQHEFSDLSNINDITRVCVRLLVATILGGILGYEREAVGASAGLRTHMMVSLGAALFVLVPLQTGMAVEDISRVIQGLAAGIGFLGAGAIMKRWEASEIHGLTTAAGIWLTAAVGCAAGMGHEATAVLSTVLALIIFSMLRITKK